MFYVPISISVIAQSEIKLLLLLLLLLKNDYVNKTITFRQHMIQHISFFVGLIVSCEYNQEYHSYTYVNSCELA